MLRLCELPQIAGTDELGSQAQPAGLGFVRNVMCRVLSRG